METRDMTREQLIELLDPSPCQVAGHRRVDWVPTGEPETMYQQETHYHCLACSRERALREALEKVEWSALGYCWWCGGHEQAKGHEHDCQRQKALGGGDG